MTKIQKFVLMLSSESDGEVVNAARAIGKALIAEGRDWHWLAAKLDDAPAAEPDKKRSANPNGPLLVLKELLKHLSEMNDKDQAFIVDMHARVLKFGAGAYVSKKQDIWISNLHKRFCK